MFVRHIFRRRRISCFISVLPDIFPLLIYWSIRRLLPFVPVLPALPALPVAIETATLPLRTSRIPAATSPPRAATFPFTAIHHHPKYHVLKLRHSRQEYRSLPLGGGARSSCQLASQKCDGRASVAWCDASCVLWTLTFFDIGLACLSTPTLVKEMRSTLQGEHMSSRSFWSGKGGCALRLGWH